MAYKVSGTVDSNVTLIVVDEATWVTEYSGAKSVGAYEVTVTSGIGGAIATSTGTNTGGAGGLISLVAGAGGSGTAGTSTGGAGGQIKLTPGAAGTGDTGGAVGYVEIVTGFNLKIGTAATFGTTAGTNGIAFLAGTAPDGTATNARQLYSDTNGDDLSVEHADGTEDELTT